MPPHKLLLADDSVTIQKVIELTFADEDVTVIAVGDGQQAIERVVSERPDIVLADVAMPERDGYEVAAFIKTTPELSHIPVLLLTGAFEPVDEARAREVQCDGVLVKPFEPQMVITRVKDLIAGRRQPAAPAAGAYGRPGPAGSVEDYFDQLDAAFAAREAPDGAVQEPRGTMEAPTVAALAQELASWPSDLPAFTPPPAEEPAASASAGASDQLPARPASTLAAAFAALLAAEQGQPHTLSSFHREVLGEDVVEQVTRRVMERIADGLVRDVVLDVAERLVREEIERIKRQGAER